MSDTRENPQPLARDVSLDVARGIAILLVVAGHILHPPASTLIYVFHMPFFFLIGGYFYRPQTNHNALRRRFAQLMIPYFIFLCLFALPDLFEAVLRNGTDDILWRIRRLLVGGEGLTAPLTVFWFPPCFFFTALTYNILQTRLSGRALNVVLAGLLVLATFNQYVVPDFWLPLALNVVAIALPMYHIGALFGQFIFRPQPSPNALLYALAALYFISVIFFEAPPMAMKRADYGIPIITLLVAICCCYGLAGISRLFERLAIARAALLYCGAASMTIMYVHMPAFGLVQKAGVELWGIQIVCVIAICLAAHWLISCRELSRVLLLGERGALR